MIKNGFGVHTYNDGYLMVVIGEKYLAIGVCGIGDGIEVKGVLSEIRNDGVIIKCDRGIPHLCNIKTLSELD